MAHTSPSGDSATPNIVAGHIGADHPLAEASVSFGQILSAQQLQLRPSGLDGVLPNPVPAYSGQEVSGATSLRSNVPLIESREHHSSGEVL